jgi:hypothetical protein
LARERTKDGAKGSRSPFEQKRLGLLVFGGLLVALFIGFAIAQGIGGSNVPSGDAAIVRGGPSGDVSISVAEVQKGIEQQIGGAESKSKEKPPKPGSKKYKELREAAFGELLQLIWIRGEAEELNVAATPKQIEQKLAQIKESQFPTPKAYKEFLDQTHFTQQEVNERVEEQVLGTEIQEQVKGEAPVPTQADIQAYYDAEKAAQFMTPAGRDVRLIINKDKAKVEAAQKMLEGDSSPKTWKEAAKKYSSDPSTKGLGGLQEGVTEEFVKGPLKAAIFDAPIGELSDMIPYQENFLLIEPVKVNREKVKTLAEVHSQISQTLGQKKQEEFLQEFTKEFQSKWTSRTSCASGFLVEQCNNYPAEKTLEKTREPYKSCYEATPKTPPKECPAPVTQTKPALPGSVTPFNPNGEKLPQRPHPPGESKEGGDAGASRVSAEAAGQ